MAHNDLKRSYNIIYTVSILSVYAIHKAKGSIVSYHTVNYSHLPSLHCTPGHKKVLSKPLLHLLNLPLPPAITDHSPIDVFNEKNHMHVSYFAL